MTEISESKRPTKGKRLMKRTQSIERLKDPDDAPIVDPEDHPDHQSDEAAQATDRE